MKLMDCQFKGYIGVNKYAFRAFHQKALGRTKFMLYVFLGPRDGWCGVIEENLSGFLTEKEVEVHAEMAVAFLENMI